jgi:hypothetical protein
MILFGRNMLRFADTSPELQKIRENAAAVTANLSPATVPFTSG